MSPDKTRPRGYLLALCLMLALGAFLRLPPHLFCRADAPLALLQALHPRPGFDGVGFDENLYRGYVNGVIRGGLTEYPAIVDQYIEVQKTLTGSILPPMRFLYIFAAYLWHQVFGTEALAALHNVASLFEILGLLLATLFAWRLKGPPCALAVAALMSFAPTQIHMSQHALVDGFANCRRAGEDIRIKEQCSCQPENLRARVVLRPNPAEKPDRHRSRKRLKGCYGGCRCHRIRPDRAATFLRFV